MQSTAKTPEEYIASLPADRQEAISKLREVILANIPEGFEEVMSYGMIGYAVPKTIYPKGYPADPKMPLAFVNLASQKNYIALYHMGLYMNKPLLAWFTAEYANAGKSKLDMGKGCIRFKKPELIPFELIGELMGKISVQEWIVQFERAREKGFRNT